MSVRQANATANLQPRQNGRKGRRNEDSPDKGNTAQSVVASDHSQGLGHTEKARMRIERHRPKHGMDENENETPVAEPEPDKRQRQQRYGGKGIEHRG